MISSPDSSLAIVRSAVAWRAYQRVAFALLLSVSLASQLSADEPLRLTHDGKLKFTPAVSANSNEVMFVLLEKPELYRLMSLKISEGTPEPLHQETLRSEFEPAFSSDGRYLVFLRTM